MAVSKYQCINGYANIYQTTRRDLLHNNVLNRLVVPHNTPNINFKQKISVWCKLMENKADIYSEGDKFQMKATLNLKK